MYGNIDAPFQNGSFFESSIYSATEEAILKSHKLIPIQQNEQITVNGYTGTWANKDEVLNWRGPIPIEQYAINQDSNPELIVKKVDQVLEYNQKINVKYLEPPPMEPSEILIRQEKGVSLPPAPPLILRIPQRVPKTPEPLIYREAPPKRPIRIKKVIRVAGKRLPPPPRRVIFEIPPTLPPKPQPIIYEKWLPYKAERYIVKYEKEPDPPIPKQKNLIIKWEAPSYNIKKEIVNLGTIDANPDDYVQRYGTQLKTTYDLPQDLKEIRASTIGTGERNIQVEGDTFALKYVNLDREGLSHLSKFVETVGGHLVTTPIPQNDYNIDPYQSQSSYSFKSDNFALDNRNTNIQFDENVTQSESSFKIPEMVQYGNIGLYGNIDAQYQRKVDGEHEFVNPSGSMTLSTQSFNYEDKNAIHLKAQKNYDTNSDVYLIDESSLKELFDLYMQRKSFEKMKNELQDFKLVP